MLSVVIPLAIFFLFNLGILIQLPEEYDVRVRYKDYNCKSFYDIKNQKECEGCWAFATVEAINDRYCIHTKGQYQPSFSEMELLTCCVTLYDEPQAGCSGGNGYDGFHYWITNGLPTNDCKTFPFGINEKIVEINV